VIFNVLLIKQDIDFCMSAKFGVMDSRFAIAVFEVEARELAFSAN
jgi:hypothetical protein